jgi:hypothetical protein
VLNESAAPDVCDGTAAVGGLAELRPVHPETGIPCQFRAVSAPAKAGKTLAGMSAVKPRPGAPPEPMWGAAAENSIALADHTTLSL